MHSKTTMTALTLLAATAAAFVPAHAAATARVSLPWAGEKAPFRGEKVFASGSHTIVVKAK